MSIGQTGKRAQQLAQSRRNRHQVNRKGSEGTLVHRRQPQKQAEPLHPATPPATQRNIEVDEVDTTVSSETTAPASTAIDVKDVAERVYKLMLNERRIDRERIGW